MALFFDADWFDARLAERELDRATLAAIVGWSEQDLASAFKDQREISPREVQALAAFLNQPAEEIARRCGVSTRAHPREDLAGRLDAIEARLARIEALLKRD
jgi:AraC-like DNA-binding protein